MALEFETMTAAGRFGDSCEQPIMDLRRVLRDNVLRSIPRFLGRWEDGQTMEIWLSDTYDTEAASDDCDFIEVSRHLDGCQVLLPDQKLVSVGFSNVRYDQLLKRFCNAKRLVRYPTLFRRDGSFDPGQTWSGPFVDFLLAELRGPLMKVLRESAWNGNQSNRHEFEGILRQLENAPMQASGGDGCFLYKPVTLDWNELTGGSGTASPDAVIDADNDEITIHGQDFAGNAGMNLGKFIVAWLERIMEYELAAWSEAEVEFELWMGVGQTNCIADMAACMQPCGGCVNPMSDPLIRDRAAEFRKTKTIWFYPYDNVKFTILTSPELVDKIILVPKTIGGRPLVAWVFRDQEEGQRILAGETPWYGTQSGLPEDNLIYDEQGEIMEPNSAFERRAFTLNLQRNTNCIDVWINTETAMVLMGLHLWLILENASCDSLIPATVIDEGLPVAISACAAVGGQPNQLDITAAALETVFGALTTDQKYVVYFSDGVTVLLGTVVSYNTGTDVLRLDFGMAVSCTTGTTPVGGTVARYV